MPARMKATGFINTGWAGYFPCWAVTLHVSARGLVLWLLCCCGTWFTWAVVGSGGIWLFGFTVPSRSAAISTLSDTNIWWAWRKAVWEKPVGIQLSGAVCSAWLFGEICFGALHSLGCSDTSGFIIGKDLRRGLGREISGLSLLCTSGYPCTVLQRGVPKIVSLWFHMTDVCKGL